MNNLTFEEVGEYLEQFHKYDGYGMAICPYHNDTNPSLRFTNVGYKCLSASCGVHGSLAKLYEYVSGRVIEKKAFHNPAQEIWRKWYERYGDARTVAKVAHQELLAHPERGGYLKKRLIDGQVKVGKLGFLDGYYTFPVRDEYDEIQGLVARASPTIETKINRYTVSPNCPIKLYIPSSKLVRTSKELYLCYGTIDVWTLAMAGYAGITGISGQELNYHNLDQYRKPMYIIPDKGEEKKGLELQCSLSWRGMMLQIDWPTDHKDLNQVHQSFGLDKVRELIENAKRRFQYE